MSLEEQTNKMFFSQNFNNSFMEAIQQLTSEEEEKEGFSDIDFKTRVDDQQVISFNALTFLAHDVLKAPKDKFKQELLIGSLVERHKRLNVSIGGKGREEIVSISQDEVRSTKLEAVRGFFRPRPQDTNPQ